MVSNVVSPAGYTITLRDTLSGVGRHFMRLRVTQNP
jgi:hypothetical protein